MADERTPEQLAADEEIGRRLQAELPPPPVRSPMGPVGQAFDDAVPHSDLWGITEETGCAAALLTPFRYVWRRGRPRRAEAAQRG